MGISNPAPLVRFTPRNASADATAVAAGAAGWVDYDLSAVLGTDSRKIWFIHVYSGGAGPAACGARAAGETSSPQVYCNMSVLVVSKVSTTGHIELYRDAAISLTYKYLGCLN